MKTKTFVRCSVWGPALILAFVTQIFTQNIWAATTPPKPHTLSASSSGGHGSEESVNEGGNSNATGIKLPGGENDTQLKINYVGIMFGPGLDFSGSTQSTYNNKDSIVLNNRPKLTVQTGQNLEFGLEARFNTFFGTDDKRQGFSAQNDNYRLGATFKNIVKTDTFSLALNPRLMLPTSPKSHDNNMRPSPELVAHADYAPKDSRYSYTLGTIYQYYLLGDNSNIKQYNGALTSMVNPWFEVDYQLSPKVQATVQYWPEWDAKARIGKPLTNVSHEIDAGFTFAITRSWQLNPMLAADLNGMNGADRLKNMQMNLFLIGSIL